MGDEEAIAKAQEGAARAQEAAATATTEAARAQEAAAKAQETAAKAMEVAAQAQEAAARTTLVAGGAPAPARDEGFTPEQISLLWEAYTEWSKHLRTWLVAYGIGAPVLFLSQKEVWTIIVASDQRQKIAWLFLSGVAIQILMAVVNKWSSHGFYALKQWGKASRLRTLASWLVDQFWIDVLADAATVVLLFWATISTFYVLFPERRESAVGNPPAAADTSTPVAAGGSTGGIPGANTRLPAVTPDARPPH